MNIIVTGAAGFIGSHLCTRLLIGGHNVLGVDDLSRGSIKNIINLFSEKSFRFEICNIGKSLENLIKDEPIDIIYHLAAWGSVSKSFDEPREYYINNITSTINICEIARIKKVNKIILAGSSSVYREKQGPLSETDELEAKSPYAATKKISEEIFKNYSETQGDGLTKYIVARFFNVYGPKQSNEYGAIIPNWILSASKYSQVELTSPITTTRSFTYIDDVIYGLVLLASTNKNTDKFDIYNLADDNEYSLSNVLNCIREFAPDTIAIDKQYRKNDKINSSANTDKIMKIGFKSRFDLQDGIRQTWSYYAKKQ